jgi:hypothetical protein
LAGGLCAAGAGTTGLAAGAWPMSGSGASARISAQIIQAARRGAWCRVSVCQTFMKNLRSNSQWAQETAAPAEAPMPAA